MRMQYSSTRSSSSEKSECGYKWRKCGFFLSSEFLFVKIWLALSIHINTSTHREIKAHIYTVDQWHQTMDVTWHNIIFVHVFYVSALPPFHFLHSHLLFVIGIWKTCVHMENSTKTLQGKHPDYPNDRHWCVYFI